MASVITKILSPSFYQQQWKSLLESSYNYYHPMFRSGSVTPLWHAMIATSVIMYTTSYYARDYKVVQQRRAIQKEAVHEYYEKHGGSPDHH